MTTTYIPSILTSVKNELGILETETHFDSEITTHINTVLSILHQLGIGPQDKAVAIADSTYTWDDLLGDTPELDMVRTQVFTRVKLIFDPPTATHHAQALKELSNELEWRAMIAAEEGLV